ncbi:MAG: DUF3857 domain-containing protein, partial [Candidatus Zixiibacteriota bacterium]
MKRSRLFLMGVMVLVLAVAMSTSGYSRDDDAGARFLSRTWQAEVNGNKLKLKVHHRLEISARRGDDYRTISLQKPHFTKLKDVVITVFGPDGSPLKTYKKKDMTEACGYGSFELYTDVCIYVLSVDAPVHPFVIDYRYTLEFSSLFLWPAPRFQMDIPVEHAEYTLQVPKDFSFAYRQLGGAPPPTITSDGGKDIYVWSSDSLPALDDFPLVPPGIRPAAQVEFVPEKSKIKGHTGTATNWQTIGEFYNELAKSCYLSEKTSLANPKTRALDERCRSSFDSV